MGLSLGTRTQHSGSAVAGNAPSGLSDLAKSALLMAAAVGALSYSYLRTSYAETPAAPEPLAADTGGFHTGPQSSAALMAATTPTALTRASLAQAALAIATLPSAEEPAFVARHDPLMNTGAAQLNAVTQSATLAAPAVRVRGPIGPSAFRLQAPDLTATGYAALRDRHEPVTWTSTPARTPPAGRGLQDLERELTAPLPMATWDAPRLFLFAASDDEAVIWTPSASPANGGVARGGSLAYVEDQVEVGEVHAGIGIEAEGLRLSVGYTEHDVETRFGNRGESYAGFNLTWRR